ncbi:MAG: hypothetical protein ACTSVU_04785 [Promethearchaeota archaeon]
MKFCPDCGNILLPKKRSHELFCRVCQKTFPMEKEDDSIKIYKKVKKINSKEHEKKRAFRTAVIVDTKKSKSMTEDEREAYGELLEMSGD